MLGVPNFIFSGGANFIIFEHKIAVISSQLYCASTHIRSKKSAHVGSTGSFSLLSSHQISGVKVSCMTVYFLIMERIC